MALKNTETANALIKDLKSKISKYSDFAKEKIPPLFDKGERKRKPPKEFVDSSYLYIRSYDGDTGIRPFSNIPFWFSPDIQISPVNDLSAYTQLLDGGKTYQFSCFIRNKGDLIVPSANTEFFLCEPSLGFDTRFAVKMGKTAGWVNPFSTSKLSILYTIPPHFSGHKCMFVRTFSFSPLDIPVDDFQLAPWLDRHVAQMNLNFVAQASSFTFNLVHLPNTLEQITFNPMTRDDIMALRHPFLADFKIANVETARFMEKAGIKMAETDRREKTQLKREKNILTFSSQNPDELPVKEQRLITGNLLRVLNLKNKNPGNNREFRGVFRDFRNMNFPMVQTRFTLQIPDMGLRKGEATAMHLVAKNNITGETKGGITLVIRN